MLVADDFLQLGLSGNSQHLPSIIHWRVCVKVHTHVHVVCTICVYESVFVCITVMCGIMSGAYVQVLWEGKCSSACPSGCALLQSLPG